MIPWLNSIGNAISIFIQMLSSFITGILSVFLLINQAFSFLVVAMGFLPSVVLVFAVAGITITIVFQFIGR